MTEYNENMSISKLICNICDGQIQDPMKCKKCGKFCCQECIKKWKKCCVSDFGKKITCPFCVAKLSVIEAETVKNIIMNFDNKCFLCNKQFNNFEEFQSHIEKCNINQKVSIIYNNNENEKKIEKKEDLNIGKNLKIIDLKKNLAIIEIKGDRINCIIDTCIMEKYSNMFTNNTKPNIMLKNDKNNYLKYSQEYDLFFCYKDNNINCKCCKSKKCEPGNCMCKSCMELNKQYHQLKDNYLINKYGRVAKINNNFCKCQCFYLEDNLPVYCGSKNKKNNKQYLCKGCQDLGKIFNNYLSKYQKL
jgi:hypothetical protein